MRNSKYKERTTSARTALLTTVIAATNALTFLWLWWARTTPLALGMAFSWLGQACLSIWWYVGGVAGAEGWILEADTALLFFFLSLYIVGGGLHIAVMQRSMELARRIMIWPVIAAFAVAILADAFL